MKMFSKSRRRVAAMAAALGLAAAFGARAEDAMPMPASAASGAMHHHHEAGGGAACVGKGLACASAVMPAFDARGRLWLAWIAGGAVSVARSDDGGRSFGAATVVGDDGPMIDVGADARPQLAIDAGGRAVLAWGVFKDKAYNAQVWIATTPAIDAEGGPGFGAPRSLSDDPASQRFPTLGFNAQGRLFAAWLDKRTVAAARRKGVEQSGAAVAYAWSDDGGKTFSADTLAEDHSCECCRLALSFAPAGAPVLVYRSIYPGSERDHGVIAFGSDDKPAQPARLSYDHWVIDGCPHHGPAVAVDANGRVHAAWFTQGRARQGLFYAHSLDSVAHFSAPLAIGDAQHQPGRPSLLAQGRRVWLAWKEFDGKTVSVDEQHSDDGGEHWSAARVVGISHHAADHPQLVSDGRHVYVSWMARDEGWRLIALDTP